SPASTRKLTPRSACTAPNDWRTSRNSSADIASACEPIDVLAADAGPDSEQAAGMRLLGAGGGVKAAPSRRNVQVPHVGTAECALRRLRRRNGDDDVQPAVRRVPMQRSAFPQRHPDEALRIDDESVGIAYLRRKLHEGTPVLDRAARDFEIDLI